MLSTAKRSSGVVTTSSLVVRLFTTSERAPRDINRLGQNLAIDVQALRAVPRAPVISPVESCMRLPQATWLSCAIAQAGQGTHYLSPPHADEMPLKPPHRAPSACRLIHSVDTEAESTRVPRQD